MGYFRKYQHPLPQWTTLNWVPKNLRISKEQKFLQDSKACCFTVLRNSRILQDFEWFSWNSCQNSRNFVEIHGFPVRITEHFLQDFQCRPSGGVDIFWNSPIWQSANQKGVLYFQARLLVSQKLIKWTKEEAILIILVEGFSIFRFIFIVLQIQLSF